MYRYSSEPSHVAVVLNLLAFYAGWFACVIGAARGLVVPALTVAGAVVALHVVLAADRGRSMRLIAMSVALGVIIDGGIAASGIVRYAAHDLPSPLPPSWILALWALFATALDVSLRWLDRRPLLGGALGFVAGPLSYLAGQRLGALEVEGSLQNFAILGVVWAAVLVLLTRLSHREHQASVADVGLPERDAGS